MNTAVDEIDEKVREFQEGLKELYEMTQDQNVQMILTGPIQRVVERVRLVLELCGEPTFTMDEVVRLIEVVKGGDSENSDVPSDIAERIACGQKARQLLDLYAEILGVAIEVQIMEGGPPVVNWLKARRVETVTAERV